MQTSRRGRKHLANYSSARRPCQPLRRQQARRRLKFVAARKRFCKRLSKRLPTIGFNKSFHDLVKEGLIVSSNQWRLEKTTRRMHAGKKHVRSQRRWRCEHFVGADSGSGSQTLERSL